MPDSHFRDALGSDIVHRSLQPVTIARLFRCFFTIGAFTFGGGYAMLPLIQKSIVQDHCWLAEEDFVDAIAVAQCSPGPIAANIAITTGFRLKGIPGALAALAGAVLPSFLILLAIATLFLGVENNRYVRGALTAMRPAIIALMASAIYDVGRKSIRSWWAALLAIICAVSLIWIGLHPVAIIVSAAVAGCLINKCRPVLQGHSCRDDLETPEIHLESEDENN